MPECWHFSLWFIMHYFEMWIMFCNSHISLIMVYKVLLWTDVFWILCRKWYKFYNNNLSVVLLSKQGGTVKLVNARTERQFSCWLFLSLNFFVYFTEIIFTLFTLKSLAHYWFILVYDMKSNLYNVFILKCFNNKHNYRTLHEGGVGGTLRW